MTLNLGDLTENQRQELIEQMRKEDREKKQKKDDERKEYKELASERVIENFEVLKELADAITGVKKSIFEDFRTIIELKEEIYNVKDNQRSHTFTTDDGKSITLGYRVSDAFDDEVHAGIEKVKNWVYSEVEGTNNERIKKIISSMLKEDKNGNLNAKRVLELRQIAMEVNDEELNEAVEIIEKSYKPQKSCYFIEASYKDETGKKVGIPLSVSAAPFEGN